MRSSSVVAAAVALAACVTLASCSCHVHPHGDPELLAVADAMNAQRFDEAERLLASGTDVNAVWKEGATLLHVFSCSESPAFARFLLDHGAEVDRPIARHVWSLLGLADERVGCTALHHAAALGRTGTVTLLLERGADPRARAGGGWTPLHLAASRGDRELCEALLARGAEPAARAEDGRTPAAVARERGHAELALWLDGR